MKKIMLIALISIMAYTGIVYAENAKSDNKTISQEEKTDAFFKNIVNTIDKTAKDSTEKVADEIKSLNK